MKWIQIPIAFLLTAQGWELVELPEPKQPVERKSHGVGGNPHPEPLNPFSPRFVMDATTTVLNTAWAESSFGVKGPQ